jgi:sulfur carrier protein ThiS
MKRLVFANFAEDNFARDIMVDDDATLADVLEGQGVSVDEGAFRVSVNGQIASQDARLAEGDKVRVTPRKMAGA